MADGLFYVDSRAPHISADVPAITVIATNVALVPVMNLPVLGSNYFSYIGKAVRIRMFGRMSTAATPGTMSVCLYWNTGASANLSAGAALLASTALWVPIASLVNTSWMFEAVVRCRAMGSSGSLLVTGKFSFLNSLTLTAAASDFMLPATAPAAVTVDLTQAYVISPQALAVTSTTNTMQVHDINFEALN
jgi:hypothetical protein